MNSLHPITQSFNEAPDFCSAYMLGVMDAQDGSLCLPELYFTHDGQIYEYAQGWESVNGPSLLSLQVRGLADKYPANMTDAEIAAELEDYADYDDYARYGIERSIQ